MKIALIFAGTTKTDYVESGLAMYLKRLQRFGKVNVICTPNLKGVKAADEQRKQEAEQILKHIVPNDIMVLLDEKGKRLNSINFAAMIAQHKDAGAIKMVFVICGAFGANENLRNRANFTLSMSDFTFSHQLARVVLAEQIYRAFTIINNHPYHNEG